MKFVANKLVGPSSQTLRVSLMKPTNSIILCLLLSLTMPTVGQECGKWISVPWKIASSNNELKAREFVNGDIAVRAKLAVNPDGALYSYTKGDSGFTYINNGLNLIENGAIRKCSDKQFEKLCLKEFKDAEDRDFKPGTSEFCVFAMEVQEFAPNIPRQNCGNDKSKWIVGNGKGRLRTLGPYPSAIDGQFVVPYKSQTSLKHRLDGTSPAKFDYLDSVTIPTVVYPLDLKIKGQMVWAQNPVNRLSVIAVAGDQGPAFGEGSIAMHQLLASGKLTKQLPGPIYASDRCKSSEKNLSHPFVSRPDKPGDSCIAAKNQLKEKTDIRARSELHNINFVILRNGKYENADSGTVQETISIEALNKRFLANNYTETEMLKRIACLDQP